MKLSLLISPHFPAKYYLLQDITTLVRKYSFKGSVIDIGCGEKPYKQYFRETENYTGIDYSDYSKNPEFSSEKPDYFFKRSYSKDYLLPFKDHSFNHAVAFQVLEHHPSPETMIKEMVRITANEGFILLSFPFIWPLHEEPNDYYRFTEYLIADLLKKDNCEIVTTKRQGSLLSVISLLVNEGLISFSQHNLFTRLLSILLFPLFLTFSYAVVFIDRLFPNPKIFLNYIVLAKKL